MEQQEKQTIGTIYKLTSPSGKSYIGQTIQPFEKRWNTHKRRAIKKTCNGCWALNAALVKYGYESFTTEILLYCNPEQLNYYECQTINLHNTLYPNGYNLVAGGNNNRNVSDATREKMRKCRNADDRRIHEESKGLPMYMSYGVRKGVPGYKIERHPNCRQKYFYSSKYTLEEKKQQALDFLKKLDEGMKIETKKQPKKNTPDGIWKHGYGYSAIIKLDNGSIIQKAFCRPTLSPKENLRNALNFLYETREKIESNKMFIEDFLSKLLRINNRKSKYNDVPIEDCIDDLDMDD